MDKMEGLLGYVYRRRHLKVNVRHGAEVLSLDELEAAGVLFSH